MVYSVYYIPLYTCYNTLYTQYINGLHPIIPMYTPFYIQDIYIPLYKVHTCYTLYNPPVYTQDIHPVSRGDQQYWNEGLDVNSQRLHSHLRGNSHDCCSHSAVQVSLL